MKYIKLFNQDSEYNTYKTGENYITPNVSYCKKENHVHFEKYYGPYNGHEYVDLGLPSGTLWAKCNVGASSETDYGLYFAWGETTGYTASQVGINKNFTWSDYDLTSDNGSTMDKYNSTDDLATLELTDDAAHVNMGGEWKMPTSTQISELIALSHSVVTKNSVVGMEFTGTNGNTLFVPFAGGAGNGSVRNTGNEGSVWSSSLGGRGVGNAFYLRVDDETDAYLDDFLRCVGFSVRGVVKN